MHETHAPITTTNNKDASLAEEAVRVPSNTSALTAHYDLPSFKVFQNAASIPIKRSIPALQSKPWRELAPLFLVGEAEAVGFFEVSVAFVVAVPEGPLAVFDVLIPLAVPFAVPAEPDMVSEWEVDGLEVVVTGVVAVDFDTVGGPDVSWIGPPVDIMIGVASEAVAVPVIVTISSLI